jgi:hypothetical protein
LAAALAAFVECATGVGETPADADGDVVGDAVVGDAEPVAESNSGAIDVGAADGVEPSATFVTAFAPESTPKVTTRAPAVTARVTRAAANMARRLRVITDMAVITARSRQDAGAADAKG